LNQSVDPQSAQCDAAEGSRLNAECHPENAILILPDGRAIVRRQCGDLKICSSLSCGAILGAYGDLSVDA